MEYIAFKQTIHKFRNKTMTILFLNSKKIEILRQFYVVCERNGSASETRRLINEYKMDVKR